MDGVTIGREEGGILITPYDLVWEVVGVGLAAHRSDL